MSELPFEIITSEGDRAEAEDEASALFAAMTLRADARAEGMTPSRPEIYITYEGETVLTIPPGRSI